MNFGDVKLVDDEYNDLSVYGVNGAVNMNSASVLVNVVGNTGRIELGAVPANEANWNCCLTNDGDSSCVTSGGVDGTPGLDLYMANFPSIPANATSVQATVHVVIRSTSASYKAKFYAEINSSSTGNLCSGLYQPSRSYTDYSYPFNVTSSAVPGLQVGVQITDGSHKSGGTWYYYAGYCTEVYAVLSWR